MASLRWVQWGGFSGYGGVGLVSDMVQLCTGSGGHWASSVVVTCYVGKQVEQGEAVHVSASDSTGCKATGGPCQEYRCPPTDHAQRMSAPKIVANQGYLPPRGNWALNEDA